MNFPLFASTVTLSSILCYDRRIQSDLLSKIPRQEWRNTAVEKRENGDLAEVVDIDEVGDHHIAHLNHDGYFSPSSKELRVK